MNDDTIRYMVDGRYPINLQREDVELAKLLWADSVKSPAAKLDLIISFRHSGAGLEEAVAIVNCALGKTSRLKD